MLRPRVSYAYSHSSGVLALPGQPATVDQHTASGGLEAQLGERWRIDYLANADWYSKAVFRNTVGHALRVLGEIPAQNWFIKVEESYTVTDLPLTETGRQTSTEVSVSSLGLLHPMTRELAFESSFAQTLRFTERFTDTYEWSTTQALRYETAKRLQFSFGTVVGYLAARRTADALIVGPQASATWTPSDKLSLELRSTFERRHIVTPAGQDLDSPNYTGVFRHRPFEATTLHLSANRSVAPSFFSGQNTRRQSWEAGIEQRFFRHVFVTALGRHETATFLTTSSAFATTRKDTTNLVQLDARIDFLRRGSASVSYTKTRNASDQREFSSNTSKLAFLIEFRY